MSISDYAKGNYLSMKSSCISHPTREPLVVVHQWQLEACDGNWCGAALLSFFEYWHNWKLDEIDRNKSLQELADRYGQEIELETESTLQFHTETDLEIGLMGLYKRRSIRESLKRLEQKGFISICRNPNPKYSFDNKKYFQFEVEAVQNWIYSRSPQTKEQIVEGISPANPPKKKDKLNTHGKFAAYGKNAGTITEITTHLLYSETTEEVDTTAQEKEKAAQPIRAMDGKAYRTVEKKERMDLKIRVRQALQSTSLSKNIGAMIDQLPVEEGEDALIALEAKIADGLEQSKWAGYFVGILKRKIDPNLNNKPLTVKQIKKMHSKRQKMDSCELEESCPPIRIKKGGEWIEAAFSGYYQDDFGDGYEAINYYLYKEFEGKRYVNSHSYQSDRLDDVEVYPA